MCIKGLENSRWKRFYLLFGTPLVYTKQQEDRGKKENKDIIRYIDDTTDVFSFK